MMRSVIPLVLALLLFGCNGDDHPTPPQPQPSPNPISLTMDAASWRFQYSPNMPTSPSAHAEGWAFEFPQSNGVHYLLQQTNGKIGTVSATFRLEREANPNAQLFEVEPCGVENIARVRIMFQERGDTLAAGTPEQPTVYQDYRWWGVESVDLRSDGPTTLSFTADPNRWSQVFGKNGAERPAQWAQAANNVQAIGFTYGGCFAGHGVFANGLVRFIASVFTAQ